MIRKMQVVVSNQGYSCLWESGGCRLDGGDACVIANQSGGKPKAFYVRKKGNLECSNHALIPLEVGFYVATTHVRSSAMTTYVYEIVSFDTLFAEVELLYVLADEGRLNHLPSWLHALVEASIDKATWYQCRVPIFCIPPVERHPARSEY